MAGDVGDRFALGSAIDQVEKGWGRLAPGIVEDQPVPADA